MTNEQAALEALAFHWGDAYMLCYTRDRWVALRRDNRWILTADTLAALEDAIEGDYQDHPVPRDFDPPAAADYLSTTKEDDTPDEDTLMILAAMRKAFPPWTITYSPQLRGWIGRRRRETICENSAVFLCVALYVAN